MTQRLTSKVATKRFLALAVVAIVFVAAAVFIKLPTPHELREWVEGWGSLAPVVFFLAYATITIAPIPRTVFTLSAGLLFGPVLGVILAVGATTIAATVAFLLVRYLGRDWVVDHLRDHKTMTAIDHHLERRGWLAVVSIRITALPFSLVNYVCGLSGIHGVQYVIATFFGVMPTTIVGVIAGDSILNGLTVETLVAGVLLTAVGLLGLLIDAKTPVDDEESADHA